MLGSLEEALLRLDVIHGETAVNSCEYIPDTVAVRVAHIDIDRCPFSASEGLERPERAVTVTQTE